VKKGWLGVGESQRETRDANYKRRNRIIQSPKVFLRRMKEAKLTWFTRENLIDQAI